MIFQVGDSVRIKDSYPDYKSARGHAAVVEWVGQDSLYQVKTNAPFWQGKDWCFVTAKDLERLDWDIKVKP